MYAPQKKPKPRILCDVRRPFTIMSDTTRHVITLTV